MNLRTILLIFTSVVILSSCERGKHLFILSGQSNMAGLKPEESFTPTIEAEYGKENVIIVKYALGGTPMKRWYRDWQPIEGNEPATQADLYDSLMIRVNAAIENEKIGTVSFIWMQGERDARQKWGEVYEKSLIGLYEQVSDDLGRSDVNYIIGRLSDYDLKNEIYEHWGMIRDIQVKVAETNPRFDWIDTDDLNDGKNRAGKEIKNDLHMSAEGYVTMGKRFADKAIEIIEKN